MINSGRSLIICNSSVNRDKTNNNNNNSSNNCNSNCTSSSSSSSSLSFLNKTFQINCANCNINRRRGDRKSRSSESRASARFCSRSRSVSNNSTRKQQQLTSANNTNNQQTNENTNLNSKNLKTKYSTQFSIKFHPFSFKIPSSNTLKSNKANHQQSLINSSTYNKSSMNQRCCLSVSVVPSDKQNGKSSSKNKNSNNKNNQDDLIEDPYTKEVDQTKLQNSKKSKNSTLPSTNITPVNVNTNLSGSLKENNKSILSSQSQVPPSTSGLSFIDNKQLQIQQAKKLAKQTSNQLDESISIQNTNNSNDQITIVANQAEKPKTDCDKLDSASLKIKSVSIQQTSQINTIDHRLSVSSISSSKSLANNNIKVNELEPQKESQTELNEERIDEKSDDDTATLNNDDNKSLSDVKQEQIDLIEQDLKAETNSIISNLSEPAKQTNQAQKTMPSGIISSSSSSSLSANSILANTLPSNHLRNNDLQTTTETNSATSSVINMKNITIDINTNNNYNNIISNRYQHFEKRRNSVNETSAAGTPNANPSIIINSAGNQDQVDFDFNLRINRLRFIDDSASSTALTSPAESLSHFNLGSINSLCKKHYQHHKQQQHRFLGSSNGVAANYNLSVNCNNSNQSGLSSTSSSRTISLAGCSTSLSSGSSTNAVNTVENNCQTADNNADNNSSINSTPSRQPNRFPTANTINNRMLTIQRQANVKSSTDTLCSDDNNLKDSSQRLIMINENKNCNECTNHNPMILSSNNNNNNSNNNSSSNDNRLIIKSDKPQQATSTTAVGTTTTGTGTEDDEEIKSIIMNNLNEKLKTSCQCQYHQHQLYLRNKNSAAAQQQQQQLQQQHHHHHHHHHHQHQQPVRNSAQRAAYRNGPSSTSSMTPTTTEFESSGSEYDTIKINQMPHQQPQHQHNRLNKNQLKQLNNLKHLNKLRSSVGAVTAKNADSSADDSVSSVETNRYIRLKQKQPGFVSSNIQSCKYCKSPGAGAPNRVPKSVNRVKHQHNRLPNNNQSYNNSCLSSSSVASINSNPPSSSQQQQLHQQQANSAAYFYGYSPINRFKNGDDRVYAYDNFDCINECIEENEINANNSNQCNQQFQNRKDMFDEDDEKCFTSILVEDGFIRMSSPVDQCEFNNNLTNSGTTGVSRINRTSGCSSSASNSSNSSCKSKQHKNIKQDSSANSSAFKFSQSIINEEEAEILQSVNCCYNTNNCKMMSSALIANNSNRSYCDLNDDDANIVCVCKQQQEQQQCMMTNFPNVGSSPLSEEFMNNTNANDSSTSSDEDEESRHKDDSNKDNGTDNNDGIIVHKGEHLESLSDEEDLLVDAEHYEEEEEDDNYDIPEEEEEDEEDINQNDDENDEEEDLEAALVKDNDDNQNYDDDDEEEDEQNEKILMLQKKPNQAPPPIPNTLPSSINKRVNISSQQPQQNIYKSNIQSTLSMQHFNNEIRPHSIMKNSSLKQQNEYAPAITNNSVTGIQQTTMITSSKVTSMPAIANNHTFHPHHQLQQQHQNLGASLSSGSGASTLSNSNNTAITTNTILTTSSSTMTTTSSSNNSSSQKPKVRFNLDINYEKEREWNRVNKILGDASKSQIEWTQEVEV